MIQAMAFFNALEDHITKNLAFVAYRKPDENIVKSFLQNDTQSYTTKDFAESGFVFSDFCGNKNLLIPEDQSEVINAEYEKENSLNEASEYIPEITNHAEQKKHETLVEKAITEIKSGTFKKVVLARKESAETQLAALSIFKNLLQNYPKAFCYIWSHPESGIWIGATPETLVKVERNRFKTMALAGTQAYKTEVEEAAWTPKEVEEQKIVSDEIVQKLKDFKVAIGAIKLTEPYTVKAGNLLHIRTDISGILENDNLSNLLESLHPTPAVCGFPREAAKQFILENELSNREFYSGFLGEINLKQEVKRNSNRRNQENQAYASISKQSQIFVNLRCMKLVEGKAEIFIGGGITADSNPTAEWEETVNKSYTIKSVLVHQE
ncbi:chorismate-binding protein [Zunongwangia endophytica]|uniref:Chorismate-binding protein n=1 Tax=Zunongwangia endophytica TaxID=1808945 RepID=A0ABV8H987_9FLAO|nr:chorismate-binding protein [Zunongwangia endophytica]MDN3593627.1 chorismate-binding protein [Zunongwangia endophytica]